MHKERVIRDYMRHFRRDDHSYMTQVVMHLLKAGMLIICVFFFAFTAAAAESEEEIIPFFGARAGELIEEEDQNTYAPAQAGGIGTSVSGTPGFSGGSSSGAAVTKAVVEDELRRWKIEALDEEDAVRRERNEMLLRESMLARYRIDHGADLSPSLKIYYICVNEMDYIAAVDGDDVQVYLACITKQGEYFVSTENLIDEVVATVSTHLTEENRSSSEEFWNKITLMDKPDGIIDGNSLRPVDDNGIMSVPYFNQGAGFYENGEWTYTEWPNVWFNVNGHTMHQAGCGFFSTAMALSYVKQELIAPVDFKENGEYIADNGSAVTVGVHSAAMYGIPAYLTGDWKTVLSALINGHPVMEHVGPSVFTSGGHYILLIGVLPDGRIAVNDPGHKDNTYTYCGAVFSQDIIQAAAKGGNLAYTVFG